MTITRSNHDYDNLPSKVLPVTHSSLLDQSNIITVICKQIRDYPLRSSDTCKQMRDYPPRSSDTCNQIRDYPLLILIHVNK